MYIITIGQVSPVATKRGEKTESSSKRHLIDESEDGKNEIEFDEGDKNLDHYSQDEGFEIFKKIKSLMMILSLCLSYHLLRSPRLI